MKDQDNDYEQLLDLQHTFLQSIQNVPGDTKADKFKYLFQKSNEIAETKNWTSVPTSLHPFINVEIVKKSHNHQLIIDALKSSDETIVKRALLIDDLFAEKSSPLLKFDYFYQEILSEVSLLSRERIIRKLAENLARKDSEIANEFFVGILKNYGLKSAKPLIFACDEKFIYQKIVELKVVLSPKAVKKLYQRYPNLTITYLELGLKPKNPKRDSHNVKLGLYESFLPCLIKKHFAQFVVFCEKIKHLSFKLSNSRTREFIRQGLDVLKRNPETFLEILDLETVSKRLNRQDFQQVVQKWLPKDMERFDSSETLGLLEFIPNDCKQNFMTTIFKNAYNSDLLQHPELISNELLTYFSAENRMSITRLNLEKQLGPLKPSYLSLRCFLSTKEIIPEIKNEIGRSSVEDHRSKLLHQMMYCGLINDDEDAFLETLQYIQKKHLNESLVVLKPVLNFLVTVPLNHNHWKTIDAIIRYLDIKHGPREMGFLLKLMERSVKYKLDHQLAIDDDIRMMFRVMICDHKTDWNILRDDPESNRICMLKLIHILEQGHLSDPENPRYVKDFLINLLNSIHCFNEYKVEKNSCVPMYLPHYRWNMVTIKMSSKNDKRHNNKKDEIVPIDVKHYPWIMRNIETVIKNGNLQTKTTVKYLLQKQYPELFDLYFPNELKEYDFHGIETVNALKRNYLEFLEHWEFYMKKLLRDDYFPKHFFEAIRWYKDIPMNFARSSLQIIEERGSQVSCILGYLLEGPEFEKIFLRVIPKESNLDDMGREEAKELKDTVKGVFVATTKSNTPISLDVFKEVITKDFANDAVDFFYNVARKSTILKVCDFADYLLQNDKVSVKKHGIRLVNLVSTSDDKYSFLERFVEPEIHRSIRTIVLFEFLKTFTENPSERAWQVLEKFLEKQTIDDESVIKKVTKLKMISSQYVVSYIKIVLRIIEKFGNLDIPEKVNVSRLNESVISQIDKSFVGVLPVDFQLELIKKHVFAYALENNSTIANTDLIFDIYLDDASNLSTFTDFVIHFVRENQKPARESEDCIVRKLLRNLVKNYTIRIAVDKYKKPGTTKALKNIFETLYAPVDNAQSFLFLTWIANYEEAGTLEKFGKIAGENVHFLTEIFGKEFIVPLAKYFHSFLEFFLEKIYNSYEEPIFRIVNSLLEINDVGPFVIATILFLSYRSKRNGEKFNEIYNKLRSSEYSVIPSLLSSIMD